ncbi:MAG: Phosphopantetheine attachment site [Nitrospirae bacterium]|jgi:acyl carrier protein|nr:Phosphopantetheine attachment site [Nitrospirota bacterium]
MDVKKEIIAIIADVSGFDIEEITLDSDLVKDLEVDSIKAIEIAVAIEKKFKVSVRDEDIPKITTTKQMIALTENYLTKKGAS